MTESACSDQHNDALIEHERHDAVAVVFLNRPNAFNALNQPMMDQFIGVFDHLNNDESVKAVVLTGRGHAFSAGVDLKAIVENPGFLNDNGLGPQSPAMQMFERFKKPVIAAVNGVAVTGGFELALNCDFIYAAKSARFADTHAFVGIVPGWGLSQKLQRLVGINRAREISFTGRYFSASEGEQWGMVNRVIDDEHLLSEAIKTAASIAESISEALYTIKALINDGGLKSLGESLAIEGERSKAFSQTVDYGSMNERLIKLKERAKQDSV